MRIALLLSVLLLSLTPVLAGESKASSYYFSKKHWSTFNWAKANSSPPWTLPGWSDEGESTDRGITFEKKQLLKMWGYEFDARLIVHSDASPYPYATNLTVRMDKMECENFMVRLANAFGTAKENDGTYYALYFSPENYVKTVNHNYQWDLGPTRLKGLCLGVAGPDNADKKGVLAVLNITHSSRQKALIPPVLLKCSRVLRFSGEAETRPLQDIVLLINSEFGHVINGAGSRLDVPKSLEVDDSHFEYKSEMKEISTVTRIDRLTGALHEESSSRHGLAATTTGSCTKLDRLERKF